MVLTRTEVARDAPLPARAPGFFFEDAACRHRLSLGLSA